MPNNHVYTDEELKATARAADLEYGDVEREVYESALRAVEEAGIPFVLGGAAAMHSYTGIYRNTKDLDLFLKAEDVRRALSVLEAAGFDTCVEFDNWLAKATRGEHFVDLIFALGNGKLRVTDEWLTGGPTLDIGAVPAPVMPVEAMIASKVYIAVRHRFDGADVVHLIHGVQTQLDWEKVVSLLGDDRELLLWHLLLYHYVYPQDYDRLPWDVMDQLWQEVRSGAAAKRADVGFRGTLLDPFSFHVDVQDWHYEDTRDLTPLVDDEGGLLEETTEASA